jgi:hypothetical protein
MAPPSGVAHLSDAFGAEVVAWPPAPVAASGAVDGYGCIAARHPNVVISEFNLTEWIHVTKWIPLLTYRLPRIRSG